VAHDLIIRQGQVIDGSGAPGRIADVAVDGERITAVGDLSGDQAIREIDATGLVVSPGFIDLHTHLDAQIGWDPAMTSCSWHGVTTALIGNCGVSFAPVVPGREGYLAELMESVEDIPREAILGGLPWDWETHPQYLDSLQRLAPALNVVGLVGHSAVRTAVMGERSADDVEPTAAELDHMRELVAESVAGGAVGFSTSRLLAHKVPDGRNVPGTFASLDECTAIADGMNDAGGGIFQAVLDFETRAGEELRLLTALAERAGDVLFTAGPGNQVEGDPGVARFWDSFLADTRAQHGRITAYAMTRPSGTLMGLVQVPPVAGARWRALLALPTLEDRLASLRDDATRAELIAEGTTKGLWYDPAYVHPLGNGATPDYHIEDGPSLAELAAAQGVHPIEVVVDRLLESEGRELFNVWFFHRNRVGLAEMLRGEHIYPGAGDAGAHAGQICDADAPTHFLAHWVRDRQIMDLAEGVHRLSGRAASVLGLIDRGTIVAGNFADLNVFDPDGLRFGYPTYVNDFPNGAGRLLVRSEGYAATLVNGVVVTEGGEHTGARPGQVLRQFRR
jgi:N-acyl-D-aspartate/D-glutamate deacylase